jgi:hypothetical protein
MIICIKYTLPSRDYHIHTCVRIRYVCALAVTMSYAAMRVIYILYYVDVRMCLPRNIIAQCGVRACAASISSLLLYNILLLYIRRVRTPERPYIKGQRDDLRSLENKYIFIFFFFHLRRPAPRVTWVVVRPHRCPSTNRFFFSRSARDQSDDFRHINKPIGIIIRTIHQLHCDNNNDIMYARVFVMDDRHHRGGI